MVTRHDEQRIARLGAYHVEDAFVSGLASHQACVSAWIVWIILDYFRRVTPERLFKIVSGDPAVGLAKSCVWPYVVSASRQRWLNHIDHWLLVWESAPILR